MRRFLQKIVALICCLSLLATPTAYANSYFGDMSINNGDIRFSVENLMEGQPVRIYATVTNLSDQDLLGTVRFFSGDQQIGGDQPISIFVGKTDDVFVDWLPNHGGQRISVSLNPWVTDIDDPTNNIITEEVFVVQDTDHDRIPNTTDPDDDNDGVNDEDDHFPLDRSEQKDTDGDTKGDNADEDDDNDGVPDEFDDLPLDPDETIDTDKDGIGNIEDKDDDSDGIDDITEEKAGTNPLSADTDGDGVDDSADNFPQDPNESLDTDKDGIGNNTDTDDDNDSIPDENDEFPLNKSPIIDVNGEDTEFTVGLLESITLDGSDSFDEDGTIVRHIWNIDGEIIQEGNSVDYIFREPGQHNLSLTVTDDAGQQVTRSYQVAVVNLRFYKQIAIFMVVIFLAILLYFKYIAPANKAVSANKSVKKK